MREMKDSGVEWIGEIPKSWRTMEIKYYCDSIYAGGTPQSTNTSYWGGDIPWIPSGSCHDCKIYYAPKTITEEGFNNSSTKMIPSNTALVAMTGATCGNTGYLTFESCANQSVTAYVQNNTRADSIFIWYLLQSAKQHLLTYQTGGAQGGVNVENCKNLKVPFVPLETQHRIADYLDSKCAKIDSIIQCEQAVIEKLKEYKLSVITEAVTKGLNPDVEMKDSGIKWIGETPNSWLVQKFNRCATIKSNLVSPENYEDYPQISPDSIEKNTGNILGKKTVRESGVMSWNHFFFKGQIIYSKIRPLLNKVTIAPYDGLCSADMYPIDTKNNTKFMVYMMLSDYFVSQVGLVTENRVKMPKINQNELGSILVSIPPIDEQQTIANYLDNKCNAIDIVINEKKSVIDKLNEYKKSLIYEVVTGKMEV